MTPMACPSSEYFNSPDAPSLMKITTRTLACVESTIVHTQTYQHLIVLSSEPVITKLLWFDQATSQIPSVWAINNLMS